MTEEEGGSSKKQKESPGSMRRKNRGQNAIFYEMCVPALKAGGDGGNFIRKKELHHNEQINVAET